MQVGDVYKVSAHKKVRIICIDRKHEFPILGLVKVKALNEEHLSLHKPEEFERMEKCTSLSR